METLSEFMIFESFWSVWFWAVHVMAWSLAAHFAMGVPWDMVLEANREAREDGPWAQATEAMILAQVFRFTTLFRRLGVLVTGSAAFLASVLVTLGTLGQAEMARALASLILPLVLIYTLTVRTAFAIERDAPRGAALRRRIRNQRLANQAVGLLAIACAVALAVWEALRTMVPF